MQSRAATVSDYIAGLPADRAAVVSAVRAAIRRALPRGYRETMQYGMIGYVVPLSLHPDGYLGRKDVPLPYVALAAQKNHYAVYLMNLYSQPGLVDEFRAKFAAAGKKLDMGKSCVRFQRLEDVSLPAIAWAVAHTPVREWIDRFEAAHRGRR